MNRFIGAVAGVALLAAAGTASADEVSGMIQSIDAAKRTITLASGETFKLGEQVPLANMKMGAEVKVSYEEKDGENVATKVVPASASGDDGMTNPPAGQTGPAMKEAPKKGM